MPPAETFAPQVSASTTHGKCAQDFAKLGRHLLHKGTSSIILPTMEKTLAVINQMEREWIVDASQIRR